MASNTKNPLKGAHTAGIFADMSIDGPIIGTLVLVVDRAKNLPNRKTIGKQDPYCAARLGKEAKKTNTDIRGGQTPKWDQELRFEVHDSPDYYQLKVSAFSDDKKTELIGETWIDLRDIIVSGGGQSDQWHTLNCRGKYAGEIRLETTYYDSRPPEKPPVAAAAERTAASSASMTGSARGRKGADTVASGSIAFGPRGPAPKRRPLPSDPVTGQPPPAPAQPQHQPQAQTQPRPPSPLPPQAVPLQGPEVARTPPRPQPNAPLAYSSKTHTPTRPSLPAAGFSTPPHGGQYQQQQPIQQALVSQTPNGHYSAAQGPDPYAINAPDAGYDSIPPATQHHHHRHQSHHSYQSHSQDRSQYGAGELPPDGANFQDRQLLSYEQPPRDVQEGYYNTGAAPAPVPTSMAPYYDSPGHPAVDDRPPPPPVHRNRNNSNSANVPDAGFRNSLDASPQKGSPLPTMRHDVLRNEAHRHSLSSAYPGRPTYRPLEGNSITYGETYPDPALHSSNQSPAYEGSGPAFDDVPSTAPLNVAGNRGTFSASPVGMQNPSTPSQNRYGESNGPTDRTSPSPMVSRDFRRASTSPQPAPASYHAAYDSADASYRYSSDRTDDAVHAYESDTNMRVSVPASLVPGMDPSLAMEVRSRPQQEERYSGHQQQPDMRYSMPAQATPPRGRQLPGGEVWAGYSQDGSPVAHASQRSQTHAIQAYSTPPQPQAQRQYDRSPGRYSSGAPSPAATTHGRGASPSAQHTIKRKSISPAPSMREDVPFDPDSFNALNPTLAKTLEEQVRPDYNEASGKIVMHDGREVDPSDHLPVETWAPEPEPKPPKAEPSATASPRDYSTPTSGRKQLRIAGRPQSSTASSGITFSSADDSSTFTPTSRNRLQKKATRQSTAAIPVSSGTISASGSPMGSAPRSPLTHSRQQQTNFTPPRPLVRASTFDYPSENHSPAYYGGSPGRTSMGAGGAAPPLPAKIAMNGAGGGADGYRSSGGYRNSIGGGGYQSGGDRSPVMSGALPIPGSGSPARVLPWDNGSGAGGETTGGGGGGGGGGGELSLVEELSKIDIGTGRARRHQTQYY